jgi:crotonobetainyl-CoA:carnitine CoA-transferase CaiB-like acyl-CoA transferase
MSGPLEGIRVIDLSRVLAGPWATQTLADMGADVIKIERPVEGDDTRQFAPFIAAVDGTARESIYFVSTNRGKRSITVDLRTPEGKELVCDLAAKSDILVENYKVGNMARLGLDHAALSARNPRLIYCSITGFGQSGPYQNRAGYDLIVEAMGGLMSLTGERDGEPMKCGVAIADILTALYSTTAILAALHERQRSGLGQHIDLALLDVQIATLANQAANYLTSGRVPKRFGNAHDSIVPYQAFATCDGQIVVAVANDSQFLRFAATIGMPGLGENPEFHTNADRVRNREKLLPVISERLRERTSRQWLEELERAQIPAGPINSLDAVFGDPQISARDLLVEFSQNGSGRPLRVVGNPIHFLRTPLRQEIPPPKLGEHTAEVLSELLGKSQQDIRSLREKGAI